MSADELLALARQIAGNNAPQAAAFLRDVSARALVAAHQMDPDYTKRRTMQIVGAGLVLFMLLRRR